MPRTKSQFKVFLQDFVCFHHTSFLFLIFVRHQIGHCTPHLNSNTHCWRHKANCPISAWLSPPPALHVPADPRRCRTFQSVCCWVRGRFAAPHTSSVASRTFVCSNRADSECLVLWQVCGSEKKTDRMPTHTHTHIYTFQHAAIGMWSDECRMKKCQCSNQVFASHP